MIITFKHEVQPRHLTLLLCQQHSFHQLHWLCYQHGPCHWRQPQFQPCCAYTLLKEVVSRRRSDSTARLSWHVWVSVTHMPRLLNPSQEHRLPPGRAVPIGVLIGDSTG